MSNPAGNGSSGGIYRTGPGTGSADPGEAAFNSALLDSVVDLGGNSYLADPVRNTISKTASNGTVTILAGSDNAIGNSDGIGSAARFNKPQSVTVDLSGNVYVADSGNHVIRKINYAGAVTTLAGSAGNPGKVDGMGTDARFDTPQGVAVDPRGNVYVADTKNHSIRKISPSGVVTTLAGAGFPGYADGTAMEARFYFPSRLALDPNGELYVADTGNHLIRKITSLGTVSTLAGGFSRESRGASPVGGYVDGMGTDARFNYPTGLTLDATGNLYVADSGNQKIRKVTSSGMVSTVQINYGIDTQRDRRDRFARRNHNNHRTGRQTIIVNANDGLESRTGTFIFDGLPSPGDVDRRYGRFEPAFFGNRRANPNGGVIIIDRSQVGH